jgi:hypothetical protein
MRAITYRVPLASQSQGATGWKAFKVGAWLTSTVVWKELCVRIISCHNNTHKQHKQRKSRAHIERDANRFKLNVELTIPQTWWHWLLRMMLASNVNRKIIVNMPICSPFLR